MKKNDHKPHLVSPVQIPWNARYVLLLLHEMVTFNFTPGMRFMASTLAENLKFYDFCWWPYLSSDPVSKGPAQYVGSLLGGRGLRLRKAGRKWIMPSELPIMGNNDELIALPVYEHRGSRRKELYCA